MNFYPLLLSDSQIVSSRLAFFRSIQSHRSTDRDQSAIDRRIFVILLLEKRKGNWEELKFFCSLAFFLSIDPLIKIKVRLIKDIRGYIIVRKKEIGKNFSICGIHIWWTLGTPCILDDFIRSRWWNSAASFLENILVNHCRVRACW